jgi:hypothetical protein
MPFNPNIGWHPSSLYSFILSIPRPVALIQPSFHISLIGHSFLRLVACTSSLRIGFSILKLVDGCPNPFSHRFVSASWDWCPPSTPTQSLLPPLLLGASPSRALRVLSSPASIPRSSSLFPALIFPPVPCSASRLQGLWQGESFHQHAKSHVLQMVGLHFTTTHPNISHSRLPYCGYKTVQNNCVFLHFQITWSLAENI